MRIIIYIIETLVLAFIITALIFISRQEHIDEFKVKEEADSTANVNFDKLNNEEYFENFGEDSIAAVKPDSLSAQ